MTKQLILFILLSVAVHSYSQDAGVFKPDPVKKEMTAIQINSTIRIDGLLNEEEWKHAKPSPRFVQIEPQQGMPANFETEVKVLYNRQYLYVGFICHDSVAKKQYVLLISDVTLVFAVMIMLLYHLMALMIQEMQWP